MQGMGRQCCKGHIKDDCSTSATGGLQWSPLLIAMGCCHTCDGVKRSGVLDLPEPGLHGVTHALRLQLGGQIGLYCDEAIAVGVLRAVRQGFHIHLHEFDSGISMVRRMPELDSNALHCVSCHTHCCRITAPPESLPWGYQCPAHRQHKQNVASRDISLSGSKCSAVVVMRLQWTLASLTVRPFPPSASSTAKSSLAQNCTETPLAVSASTSVYAPESVRHHRGSSTQSMHCPTTKKMG